MATLLLECSQRGQLWTMCLRVQSIELSDEETRNFERQINCRHPVNKRVKKIYSLQIILTFNDSRDSCSLVKSSSPSLLPSMCWCKVLSSLNARYWSVLSSSSAMATLVHSLLVTVLSSCTPSLHTRNTLLLRGTHWREWLPPPCSSRDTGTVANGLHELHR